MQRPSSCCAHKCCLNRNWLFWTRATNTGMCTCNYTLWPSQIGVSRKCQMCPRLASLSPTKPVCMCLLILSEVTTLDLSSQLPLITCWAAAELPYRYVCLTTSSKYSRGHRLYSQDNKIYIHMQTGILYTVSLLLADIIYQTKQTPSTSRNKHSKAATNLQAATTIQTTT